MRTRSTSTPSESSKGVARSRASGWHQLRLAHAHRLDLLTGARGRPHRAPRRPARPSWCREEGARARGARARGARARARRARKEGRRGGGRRARTLFAVLALAATALVVVNAEIPEEDDVLVLDDDNFEDAVSQHDPLLVEFYAPWCGHCKRLAPEYASAAGVLKGDGIRIAKVDATENRALAEKFQIQGFPTLKFFKGGNPSDYGGGRTKDAIVSWVRKRAGPATTSLADADAVSSFLDGKDTAVIGVFADTGSDEAKAFEAAASATEDQTFGVASPAAAKGLDGYSGSGDAVVLVKTFDDGNVAFEGDLTDKTAVAQWVAAESLPLVIEFSQETAPKIFGSGIPTHFLVFLDPEESATEEIEAELRKTAKAKRGDIIAVTVAPTESRVMEYFGITAADIPAARLVTVPEGGGAMKKYNFDGDFKADTFNAFVEDFKAGNLKAFLKSEDPEEDDLTQDVAVLRGSTFESVALDESKDVLVEFYAPWCGHCKKLAPIYDEVGAKLRGSDNVVVAKMDATANEIEVDGVDIRGFPTLYFFPAGANKAPVEFDGDRTAEGIISYIKKHATNPVNVEDDDEL